jgi:hypothetical protein
VQPTDEITNGSQALPASNIDGDGVSTMPVQNQASQNINVPPELPQLPTSQLSAAAQGLDFSAQANPPIAASTTPKTPTPPIVEPPNIADDDDLIEQEWVDKAKAIVERTRNDPYLQNQELGKFKADYIKKRYNREIKVTED